LHLEAVMTEPEPFVEGGAVPESNEAAVEAGEEVKPAAEEVAPEA